MLSFEVCWKLLRKELEVKHPMEGWSGGAGFTMSELKVFVSVGGTASEKQEAFVRAVEERLRSEGLVPHTA
jgi:hypothetical protein